MNSGRRFRMFNPGISEKSCLDRAPVKRRFLFLCSSDFDSTCWYGKLTQFRSFRCLYFIGFIIFGQEMRVVAISKVGHKMQNFAEGLEHKINTFSWPIKGGFSSYMKIVGGFIKIPSSAETGIFSVKLAVASDCSP
ncbi:hypothetical protein QL285_008597 [Trifolium repens]|nr:hypothetical protein QL285_008597 [Trifolium repens]